MECNNFWLYFGAEEKHKGFNYLPLDDNAVLRALSKISSLFLFLFMVIYIIVLKVKYKAKFQEMISSSIFSFFDDLELWNDNSLKSIVDDFCLKTNTNVQILDINENDVDNFQKLRFNNDEIEKTTSLPSFDKNEIDLLNKEIASSFKKNEEDRQKDRELIYICNFEDCFCNCLCDCCYQSIYKNIIKKFFVNLWKMIVEKFKRNLKYFCFYFLMIGTFLFNPLRNFLSIFFNACHDNLSSDKTISVFFSFLDLICGSFAMVLYFFFISFASTQAEFFKIYLFDKSYRARLIYFHLKKALIFGFLHFILKLLYKIAFLFESPFDNMNDPYDIAWLFFKNCFFLASIKCYYVNFWFYIEGDCEILRAHARYFVIQSGMLKLIPKPDSIYHFLKKIMGKAPNEWEENESPCFSKSHNSKTSRINIFLFEEKIQKYCQRLNLSLHEELKIIDRQKFQNILRNQGYLRYIPRVLIFSLISMSVSLLVFLSMSLLSLSKLSEMCDEYSLFLNRLAGIGYLAVSVFECLALPFLMYYSLKKTTYFNLKRKKNY